MSSNSSKIDLSANTRNSAIGLLQPRLSDAIDLASQAKQAHWTVKGANFVAMHALFDRIAGDIGGFSDLIAERIASLGGQAEGTARITAERSSLPIYPLNITDSSAHVEALSTALALFGGSVRHAIGAAADVGDQTTADVFTEISRGIDQLLWFVEAHAASGDA
ncbi:MAG: DNA starvation/stationary phase protection protein Dps [Alphaproteobacteria bacterium]|nr:DNA starvation/stationary phase protection protein Dps [Alphaproteobacteria bacterium]